MSEARAGRGAQGRVGTVINGKWQVDARIGSGGMATVYAATHRNGHRAALKMLHTQLSRDPSMRARFLREGYVANAVGHPGVVAVLDDGIAEDGAAFLVLELLEGETIDARRVRLGGKLPVDEALDLADQALDALAAAHDKGIVHRDVKPENVFLTNEGRLKLLDFGLARMKDAQAEATRTGVTIGTPEFMPPEQAAGRRDAVDARSDVWSLGATLFTTITGRYVHEDAQSLHEQLIASATVRPQPIRQYAPHLSPAVAHVIDRALELEKDDRWPSARHMQAALHAARDGRAKVLRAESATLFAAAIPSSSSPSRDGPVSSDQTVELVAPTESRPRQRHEVRRAVLGEPALPASLPRVEDAADIEETVVDDGRMLGSALGSASPRDDLDIPTPIHPMNPRASRPDRVPSSSAPHIARGASHPAPRGALGPIRTPLLEHAVPATELLHHVGGEQVADAHAETVALAGPSAFVGDLGSSNTPSAEVALARSTAVFPALPAPPAVAYPRPPPARGSREGSEPMPPAPPLTGPSRPVAHDARGQSRAIVVVALVLLLLCAAMAAYVMWHAAPTPK